MKKIMLTMLSLMLIMNLGITSYAIGNGESSSTDVKATYTGGADAGKVYSVDISWQGMNFTYTDADTKWDPESHTYTSANEPYWSEGAIMVTNHSNTAVTAVAAYTAEENYQDITMGFSKDSVNIDTADNGKDGAAGTAVSETITVTPSGTLPKDAVDVKIGTITLTIS